MLFYTTPSFSDYYTPSAPPASHPLSRFVPARTPTARERYLSAVAEAQAAREGYVRELEEQRLQESIRRQEALHQAELHRQEILRQAALHRQEALRQAALRNRQAQFIARRRASRASMGGCYPEPSIFTSTARPQSYTRPQPPAVQQFQTVEDLFTALMGVDEVNAATEREEQLRQQAHAEEVRKQAQQEARARLFRHLDAIKAEVSQARTACDLHARRAEPTTVSPAPAQDNSSQGPTRVEIHRIPLFRKPEIPRARDRAARTIQRQWRSHSADAAARRDAFATIELLRNRFQFLRNTFMFPEHVEFKAQEPGNVEAPALSYSPLNAGVHAYTNELTKLIMQADAVSSGGSRRVRDARRAFVQAVEEQLEAVEARVKKVWGKRAEGAVPKPQESPITTPAEVSEASAVPMQSGAPTVAVQPEAPSGPVQSEAEAKTPSDSTCVSKTLEEPEDVDISTVTSQVVITSEDQPQTQEGESISVRDQREDGVSDSIMDDTHVTETVHAVDDALEENVAVDDAPGKEDIASQDSPLADLVIDNTGTSTDEQDTTVHNASSDPVLPASSITSHPDVSTPSGIPESAPSTPVSKINYSAMVPAIDPSRAVSEPFDVIYPDSRSTTPSNDSAHSSTDDNAERPKRREREDEGFEIL